MSPLRALCALVVLAGLVAGGLLVLSDDAGPFFPGSPTPPPPASERGFRLEQNQPNPFQQTTVIVYSIPDEEPVQLRIYNTLGAPVITLVNGVKPAGFHQVEWDGRDRNGNRLPGGIYFYQLTAGDRQELRRMVLLP
ncbi:MAG: FlgD immunoglobulin-like domain containing protein [Gemmatimonadota bacterium]